MSGEVERLSEVAARSLTDRIKNALTIAYELIEQAWTEGAWYVLAYESWDAYCAAEFTQARMISPPREQRREICERLRDAGMSQREIASAVGVGVGTVNRDLERSTSVPTGTDVDLEPDIIDAELVDDVPEVQPRARAPRTDVVGTMATIMRRAEEAAEKAALIKPSHLKSNREAVEMWHRVLSPHVEALNDLLSELEKQL